MTCLQELFFRLISSDTVLQTQSSRCFKLQINSFALELVQSESLRIVLWLWILHTWTNCLACPIDYFDTLLLSKLNRWLVKHPCSNKRRLYSKLSYLGRNISNCILYNFQFNWVNNSYSSLSSLQEKRILRLLKWLIVTVRRVANVHLRQFPNRRWCWGRNCLLRQFKERSYQPSLRVLRRFLRVAKEELSFLLKVSCDSW